MFSKYLVKLAKTICVTSFREFEDSLLPLDLFSIFPLHLIIYTSRLIMISDDKPTSPIARSSEYISIEESELRSIDYEEDSISESLHEKTVPSFEVFLKIKPTSKKGISIFHDNSKYYEVFNTTTLITKFKPNSGRKHSKLSAIISNKKSNQEYENTKRFVFTKIFESDITQSEFFDQIMKPRINDFLNGHNSTIMSFGITNSGKTYTLHGTPDQPGLIPRSIEYIFSAINCTLVPWYKLNPNNTLISLDDKERLEESEKKVKLLRSPIINVDKFTEARRSLENSEQTIKDEELNNGESMYAVWLSFAEIYNENIYDLLDFEESIKNRPLKLIGDKNGHTYVQGLTTIYVTSPFEACQILVAGQSRMSSSFTNLNPKSSRSHTIFTIGLLKYQKAYAPHETETSTLTFCDMAGSGRSKGLGDNIERLQEAKNINKSLLVLGRCLKTVQKMQSTKQINEHVAGPFRESKLTRIFQRTLSGQEHATFLINIDFSSELINEIKSILNISTIARKIGFDIKRLKKLKDSNVHTSRTNESEICHEFKSLNCNLNDTKTIQSSEQNSTLRNENFNTNLNINDRIDSVDTIDDLKTNDKKFKIDELTYREDNSKIYQSLEDKIMFENLKTCDSIALETNESEICHESLNCNLNDTKTIQSSEQNSTLRNENFNTNLNINDRIDNVDSIDDLKTNDKNFKIDELTCREDNKIIYQSLDDRILFEYLRTHDWDESLDEMKFENPNLNVANDECSDKLKYRIKKKKKKNKSRILNNEYYLNKITKLSKQLSKKTFNIEMLTLQLESCKNELNETENGWKNAENENVMLLKKIETLNNVIKGMECKSKDFYAPQPPFYLEEKSSPLDDKIHCQFEKNHLRLSSIMENSFFGDDLSEPREFIVQAHVDIKKHDFKDTAKSFVRKDYSNVLEMKSKNILEVSGNDLRVSNASSKNDSGIIIDESFDSKNCYSDKSICENRNNILFDKELGVLEKLIDTQIEFDQNKNELKEKFELNEEKEFVRMKCFQFLTCKCQCLEDLLKWIKKKRDLQNEYCKTEHLSKLDELKEELSLKTIEIDKANEKILIADRDLSKLHDLTKRLNELTIIVAEFHKNNNDLYDELRKRSDIQLKLEMKLKYFASLMEAKEKEIENMKENISNIFNSNAGNNEKSKDLDLRIIEIKGRLDAIRKELINSEEQRIEIENKSTQQIEDLKSQLTAYKNDSTLLTQTVENLNEKKDELIEMKTQLLQKEREMNLFKSNRDSTIKRYEYLVKQLQEEIVRFKEQFRQETSELKIKESMIKCPAVRTVSKFKVSESFKKLTRVGKNSDGNWRPSYLRKKSTADEKSVSSTCHFSVTQVSSSNETIVESTSENNSQFKQENESIGRIQIEDDQILSSQTESDVDSNESNSRATDESSTRTKDYDSEDSDEISCRTRRNRMTGWMRIRRIDARTVLPSCSDFQLDSNRSDY